MSFKVRQTQNMARNFRRLLKSQCNEAIHHLEAFSTDPGESVHQTRIMFKRIRTLLRLLRKALDKATFQHFNYAFRDLGLALSAQRDNFVKQQTMQALHDGEADSSGTDYRATAQDKQAVEAVLNRLFSLREELAALVIRPKGFKLIRKTGAKIYRDNLLAMQRARSSGLDEDFHEWRKSAKHYYHFIAILHPIQPLVLKPLRDELYALALLLGQDHDLTLLKADARKKRDQKLEQMIVRKQQGIRDCAFKASDQLFTEAEDEIIRRLESDWLEFRQPRQQDSAEAKDQPQD